MSTEEKKIEEKKLEKKEEKKAEVKTEEKTEVNTKKFGEVFSNLCKKIKDYMLKKSYSNIILWFMIIIIIGLFVAGVFIMKEKNKEKIDVTKNPKNIFHGSEFVTRMYPKLKDLVIVGDSYSYFIGDDVGNDLVVYASPGLRLDQLGKAFEEACKTDKEYALIFIGPNDLANKTPIATFKFELSNYVQNLIDSGKTVLVASYLDSEYTDEAEKRYGAEYACKKYDKAMQEVCVEKNAVYVDCKDINDYHNNKRQHWDENLDSLHFNQKFYIDFINKVYSYIYVLELQK